MVSVLPSEKHTNLLQNSDRFDVIGVVNMEIFWVGHPVVLQKTFQRNLLPPFALQKCSYSEEEGRTFL
jgi:hypothetical protein